MLTRPHPVHWEQRITVPPSWGKGVVTQSFCGDDLGILTTQKHKITCSLCLLKMKDLGLLTGEQK